MVINSRKTVVFYPAEEFAHSIFGALFCLDTFFCGCYLLFIYNTVRIILYTLLSVLSFLGISIEWERKFVANRCGRKKSWYFPAISAILSNGWSS
jgi:hypothetical protein